MARTLVASDGFTVASNTNLESHASNWTAIHTYGPGFAAARASDDVAYCPFNPAADDLAYRWTGAGTFAADQYCSAIVGNFVAEASGNGHGVLCRSSADTGAGRDYYALCVDDAAISGSSHNVRLQRVANGTTTTLYSASRTYTNGDTIELEVSGSGATVTLKMFQNGVQFGGDQSDTDATRITAAGKPGLVLRGGSTGMTLDDWAAGDVTASSGPLTGGFTLDDPVFSGAFATGALSQVAGSFTLDDFLNSGVLGLAPGIVTTQPFKNWTGTLLPGITVANVVFIKLDRTQALALASQSTAGDGVMTIANASLVTGTSYIMVSFDATGLNIGAELVVAA